MSKKISLSLSVSSINKAIKLLDEIKNTVDKAKIEAIKEVCEGAKETIYQNTPFDTGESASSTTYTINETHATIKQRGSHVIYNEFGTGPIGAGNPYPKQTNGWVYGADGWTFYQDNTESKYFGRHYTLGQPAHAQMYKGSQYIKDNISRIMKKKVSDALSRI